MNSCFFIGNITKDLELSKSASGISYCRFAIAVNRPKREGQEQITDFITIMTYRTLAETCAKYLSKGRKVYVGGKLETSSYTNKEGQKRFDTYIVANEVEFLYNKSTNSKAQEPQIVQETQQEPTLVPIDDDTLPF